MDPVALLVVAFGSLACLQVAALNLRGTERPDRPGRAAREARPRA